MEFRKIENLMLFCTLLFSCTENRSQDKPNIILIMADDMGYECLSSYGSTSYQTPVLDSLAAHGILFSHCVSQPLCTPSRVKLMTGKYNYRNYGYFGHLDNIEYTFGNLMNDAGYATCIAGKWQLNGITYKQEILDWNDNSRPAKFGFEEYCLWQLTQTAGKGERYANPLIEQNGETLELHEDAYGPDVFANFIIDFIERKKDVPFFVYYPMVLVHNPFVPTPDSDDWRNKDMRYKNDTAYFKDMVAYTDKIVGRIVSNLKDLGLDENTIVIFTGDNGTNTSIRTQTTEGLIRGGKGNTTAAGTHVPLIISWPKMKNKGIQYDGLIEFSDFYPTFAEIVNKQVECDGKSFLPLLTGSGYIPRETAFVHYDPQWSAGVNKYRNQFVRTVDYKLYQDGKFFNLKKDILEESPLDPASLNETEIQIRVLLENELKKHPAWDKQINTN